MTNKINRKEVAHRSGIASRGGRQSGRTWQVGDAGRFQFKAQCYDAGPDSETRCHLCGRRVRLCYVLKVLETADPCAPEVGKLTIGECCFKPIKAVNEKLCRQLLAAAINLRTFIEAIQRDQQMFGGGKLNKIDGQQLPHGAAEELIRGLFDSHIGEGGDHA